MLDGHLRVQAINRAFTELFGLTADDALHRHVYDLSGGQWDAPELHRLLDDVLPRQRGCADFRVQHEFVRGQPMQLAIDAARIDGGDPGTTIVVLAIHDAPRPDASSRPPAAE
jgi:PAS domain-containing protein